MDRMEFLLPESRSCSYRRLRLLNQERGSESDMARARRPAAAKGTTTAPKSSTKPSSGTDEVALACPECGATFTRAASLGAHRNRAHGVAGASTRAQRTRARRGHRNGGGTTRRDAAAQTTRQQTTPARRRSNSSASGGINRDSLLQALFPNGVPAREEVIRRANAWLDEAEQLARSK
jgi:uncharacterized C2H2 Zn-finger protein